MDKRLIFLGLLAIIILSAFTQNQNDKTFLEGVLEDLENIESATYLRHAEIWQHGDTICSAKFSRYVESYRNSKDTTIGASWVLLDANDKTKFEFAYDGKMRALVNHDIKAMMLDSFTKRKLSFRPVSTPFYNYTESIIQYILNNKDSTIVEQKDMGEDIYIKLTIHEDKQVEFFGKAHYIPNNPYTFDCTSIYALWINKKTNLPYKVRREMSHDISVSSVTNAEFNKLNIDDFAASDYFPKDYEVIPYGQKGKEKPSAFVAIECVSKNINVLKRYMERHNFEYPFLLSNKEVLKSYSINSFPIFIILDENRVIQKVITGYGKDTTDKALKNEIDKLI